MTIYRLDQAFQLTFEENESPALVLLKGDSGTGTLQPTLARHVLNNTC